MDAKIDLMQRHEVEKHILLVDQNSANKFGQAPSIVTRHVLRVRKEVGKVDNLSRIEVSAAEGDAGAWGCPGKLPKAPADARA